MTEQNIYKNGPTVSSQRPRVPFAVFELSEDKRKLSGPSFTADAATLLNERTQSTGLELQVLPPDPLPIHCCILGPCLSFFLPPKMKGLD